MPQDIENSKFRNRLNNLENKTSNVTVSNNTSSFNGDVDITGNLHLISTGPAGLIIEADTDNITESDNANILLKQDGGIVQAEIGYFSDDNNVLRYNNVYAGDMWFGTSDTPRLYIDSLGEMGVGTTTPNKLLHVYSTTSDPVRIQNSSDANFNRILYQKPSRIWSAGQTSGNDFAIADETAGSYRFFIDTSGRVGIGTTSPARQLSLVGQISVASGGVGEDVGYNGSYISTRPTTTNQHINLIRSGNRVWSLGYASGTNTFLIAGGETTDSSFGNNQPFSISTAGSVGIGTTSPSSLYKLDVSGEVRSTVGFRFPDGTLQITAVTASGSTGNVNSGLAGYYAYYASNGNTVDDSTVLYTNGTNLGVGTTSVATYKLNVNGGANITGDIFVNGLTVGKGGNSVASNTALGINALLNPTGDFNTAIGRAALNNLTTGKWNTAIGASAGASITNATGNVAIGLESLFTNLSGSYNVSIGQYSLYNNKTDYNTAIGYGSLENNSHGSLNSAVGYGSLNDNTIGQANTAVGYGSLTQNITGSYNTAIGYQSLGTNKADYNTAVGYAALQNNSIGTNNVALGAGALLNNTSGSGNIAIGVNALIDNTNSGSNLAIGVNTLRYNKVGTQNIAIGNGSMSDFNSGSNNVAIGINSNYRNTTGFENVSVGFGSLSLNRTGYSNVAIGHYASYFSDSGYDNTVVGREAMFDNSKGYENSAFGAFALANNVTGNLNVAIGKSALLNNISGTGNTALGTFSSYLNTAGDYNTTVGYDSGLSNTFDGLVAVGYRAAYGVNAAANTAIGIQALYNSNTSGGSTAVGYFSLFSNQGQSNTAVGGASLFYNTAGTYNTAIGTSCLVFTVAGAQNTNFSNSSGIGAEARISGHNQVQLGNSTTRAYAFGALIDRSDIRDKADIENTSLGLNFIKQLRPVDYRWDYRDDYFEEVEEEEEYLDKEIEIINDEKIIKETKKTRKIKKLKPLPKDGSKKRVRKHHGFIAQEIKETIDKLGIDFGGYQDHKIKGGEDVLSLGYTELIAPIVKSVQELSIENDYLKNKLEEKDKQIQDILLRLSALENKNV